VYRKCSSTCALIWLAGNPRFVLANAGIGFHAAHDSNGTSGVGNAVIGAYLRDLGMSLAVIVFATSAPPDSVTWLTEGKAKELGLKIIILSGRKAEPPKLPIMP
jgi:hypothetical protein